MIDSSVNNRWLIAVLITVVSNGPQGNCAGSGKATDIHHAQMVYIGLPVKNAGLDLSGIVFLGNT